MKKQAILVTLSAENVLWLWGRAIARGEKNVSKALDRLISSVRTGGKPGEAHSVVGTLEINEADPDLLQADAALRAMFQASLERTDNQLKLNRNL